MRQNPGQVHAVIMAGGQGTRMRDLVGALPKVLIPLGGRTILDYILDSVIDAGVHHVHLMLGHHAELVQVYVQAHRGRWPTLELSTAVEKEDLGTAGPLRSVADLDTHVVVLNGDVITEAKLGTVIDDHVGLGSDLTVVGADYEVRSPFATLQVGSDQQLLALTEKPVLRQPVAMGIYVLGPRARALVTAAGPDDMPDLIRRAIDADLVVRAHSLEQGALWREIGEPQRYLEACRAMQQRGGR